MISTEEKKEFLEIAIDEAKDSVHLIAQVGDINLNEAVELGKYVKQN